MELFEESYKHNSAAYFVCFNH